MSDPRLEPMHTPELLDALGGEIDRFPDLLAEADLAAPVPALGRWKVRDVVAHLGGVHRWATRVTSERSMDGPGFRKSKLDGPELVAWFLDGLARLAAALDTDPNEPCPNFNPGSPPTMRFWQRRQLHETVVHRWDIERGLGLRGVIEPRLAADGVDEHLDVFVRTRGKQTLVGALDLVATDVDAIWSLQPDPARAGRVLVAAGGGNAATALAGPASDLLLHLWGRLALDETDLEIAGDDDIARSLRPA